MKNKLKCWLIIGVLVGIITTIIYININYLFNPFNYPGGLINSYGHNWYTFKNPISIEVRGEFFYFYEPIVDNRVENKYMIEEFAKFEEIKITNEEYEKMRINGGRHYQVSIRRYCDPYLYNFSKGEIFIVFNFYEKSNVAIMGGTIFYEMPPGFKEHIINTHTEVVFSK